MRNYALIAISLQGIAGCVLSQQTKIELSDPESMGMYLVREDNTKKEIFAPTTENRSGELFENSQIRYSWDGERLVIRCPWCSEQDMTVYDEKTGLLINTSAEEIKSEAKKNGYLSSQYYYELQSTQAGSSYSWTYITPEVRADWAQVKSIHESTSINDGVFYLALIPAFASLGGIVVGGAMLDMPVPVYIGAGVASFLAIWGASAIFLFWNPVINTREVTP